MKKIPRDITGYELIKIIEKFGYQITRQTGSHIRLTTKENGIHHVTYQTISL
jgi:predicted RNA binding protein YcfA (HicA-like mRNA interferase family)